MLFYWTCVLDLSLGLEPTVMKPWSRHGGVSRSKTRQEISFSQTAHIHTTSALICINKLKASAGKQTLLLEDSTTGHHMCLLR